MFSRQRRPTSRDMTTLPWLPTWRGRCWQGTPPTPWMTPGASGGTRYYITSTKAKHTLLSLRPYVIVPLSVVHIVCFVSPDNILSLFVCFSPCGWLKTKGKHLLVFPLRSHDSTVNVLNIDQRIINITHNIITL